MDIETPIFFVGAPRSGTTIAFESFSIHEKLCWLSNYCYHIPVIPHVGIFQRLFFGIKGEKDQGQKLHFYNRILPKTAEVYKVWEHFFGKKFSYTFLMNKIPKEQEVLACRKYVKHLILFSGKERFTAKFTGPPRILFLNKVFPESVFINIVRDPRAVIASLFRVDFWEKNMGFEKPYWDKGLDIDDLELWRNSKKSPVVLAALLWRKILQMTKSEAMESGSKILNVRYEDLMADPKLIMEKLLDFSKLSQSKKVKAFIESQKFINMNFKYKEFFSARDIEIIQEICSKEMKAFNYD
jgi:hypothetical protein